MFAKSNPTVAPKRIVNASKQGVVPGQLIKFVVQVTTLDKTTPGFVTQITTLVAGTVMVAQTTALLAGSRLVKAQITFVAGKKLVKHEVCRLPR